MLKLMISNQNSKNKQVKQNQNSKNKQVKVNDLKSEFKKQTK